MKNLGCFRDITTSFDGHLDLRSENGKVGIDNFRVLLNVGVDDNSKRCRLGGWKKLFSDSIYGFLNQDLHDQLLCLKGSYDQFDQRFVGGGNPTGAFSFPYFVPEYERQGPTSISYDIGRVCGYPPDFYDTYFQTPNILNGCFLYSTFAGFPYSLVPYSYTDPCNTGAPSYYKGSHFYVGCQNTPFMDYPGYGYGAATPILSNSYDYVQDYCGDYFYTTYGCREAVTLLSEFKNDAGIRKLIAGTQTSLFQLNERTGNWRIIADGLGGQAQSGVRPCAEKAICDCGVRRFSSTVIGNYMLFTNNFDPVMAYLFDDQNAGCEVWAAHPIDDLMALGVERARAICAWKGFVFIGNITENGTVRSSRVQWSDFNSPLIWVPEVNNEANFQDLGSGEEILRIEPLGDFLFIYTNVGIWQCVLVEASQGRFRFRQIYKGPDIPTFPYSLVNTGDVHLYCGENGIFSWGLFDTQPKRIEWIHKASGAIYNGVGAAFLSDFPFLLPFGKVNRSQCFQVVGGYDALEKQVWFSWPSDSNQCPNVSLILNLRYGAASIVDHGFTAFVNFTPDDRPNIRDFLFEWQVCHFSQTFSASAKEGTPYQLPDTPFSDPPSFLFNATENPDLPLDPDSLCARLGDLRIQDICQTCDSGPIFVMASATDYCLKQFTKAQYYRERFAPGLSCSFAIGPDGARYCADGYSSMAQSDMNNYGTDVDKVINGLLVDFEAEAQTTPNQLQAQISYGAQPKCTTWKSVGARDMKCLTDQSAAEHAANNTRPGTPARYNAFWRGRYIGWRIYVDVPAGYTQVAPTGGGVCFSQMTQSVRRASGEWPQ